MMDEVGQIGEFASRLFHVHAKDVRLDRAKLDQVGILAPPLAYHTPKLPGLGSVRWGDFFAALTDARYNGPVCVEVEDRAYEGSLADRERALRQSAAFLRQFVA
jgi:sugar phosphate isomerase/epimerase